MYLCQRDGCETEPPLEFFADLVRHEFEDHIGPLDHSSETLLCPHVTCLTSLRLTSSTFDSWQGLVQHLEEGHRQIFEDWWGMEWAQSALVLMHARKMIQLENPPDFISELREGSFHAGRCFLGSCFYHEGFFDIEALLQHFSSHHYDRFTAQQDAYVLLVQNAICRLETSQLQNALDISDYFGSYRFPVLEADDCVPANVDRGRNLVQRNTRKPFDSPQNRTFTNQSPSQLDLAGFLESKSDLKKLRHWRERPDASISEEAIFLQDETQLEKLSSRLSGEPGLPAPVSALENWSGRGSDVAFDHDDHLPFVERGFLGRGATADVHEIVCNGVTLARKKIYCSREVRLESVKGELKVLSRLHHLHVISLIGSYTQGKILGLLLWPVAVCDLSTFMDMTDTLGSSSREGLWERFGISDSTSDDKVRDFAGKKFQALFGCTASAINYLHANKIRHKDLKPGNILLTKDNVYVTDFGMSRDFSGASTSMSDGIERGTVKYSAPEVIRYEPHGRAADIFSLGCIYLEMVVVWARVPLSELKDVRSLGRDMSFQANIDAISIFRHKIDTSARIYETDSETHTKQIMVFDLIVGMMAQNPDTRPSAMQIIGKLTSPKGLRRFFDLACTLCDCMDQQIYDEPSKDRPPAMFQNHESLHGDITANFNAAKSRNEKAMRKSDGSDSFASSNVFLEWREKVKSKDKTQKHKYPQIHNTV
ncbi:MAG: hypothetical protein M4579_000407 [Chaenotheca gracillima]|nr:MAG: hypothetical protein M4579_000407 [Chaenotheca gracillima]